MIEPTQFGYIHLPVRSEIRGGAQLPEDFDISSIDYEIRMITMHPQWWSFPMSTVRGCAHQVF